MNCYECATQGQAQQAAVAICASCGAATCPTHSHPLETLHSSAVGLGRGNDEHTRTIVCETCDRTLGHHHLVGRAGARS